MSDNVLQDLRVQVAMKFFNSKVALERKLKEDILLMREHASLF